MKLAKYRCRPLPAVRKRRAVVNGTQVLPPLTTVHNLAKYNVPGAHFNPTELKVDAGLSETEWSNIGRAITHVESASRWWIGDWLQAGTRHTANGPPSIWRGRPRATISACSGFIRMWPQI